MAKIVTLGSNTLTTWLEDFNNLSKNVGDLVSLTTTEDSDIVGAINSVLVGIDSDVARLDGRIDTISGDIGSIDLSPYLKNDSAFTKTAGNVTFNDNIKLNLGTSSDLQIYHNATNSFIDDLTGTGSLYIRSNQVLIRSTASENMIVATENGSAALYYDNALKLETSSTGVSITGVLAATGDVSGSSLTTTGDAVITGVVTSNTDNQSMIVYGGTSGNGANIEIYGGSHSTLANDINYDANQHNFRTQAGTATFTIDASGNATSTAGIVVGSTGSAATPAVRFNSDPNTGIYNDGADVVAVSAGGAQVVRFDTRGTEFTGALDEEEYVLGTASGVIALDPALGTIWVVTMSNATTFTDSLVNGESMLIDIAGNYTVTWPTMTWIGTGGTAPTLETTGRNFVTLVKRQGSLYGVYAGSSV